MLDALKFFPYLLENEFDPNSDPFGLVVRSFDFHITDPSLNPIDSISFFIFRS